MSITLSLSPVGHAFPDYAFGRSNTLTTTASSNETVHHFRIGHTISASSSSLGSIKVTSTCRQQEQDHQLRTVQSTIVSSKTRPQLRKVVSHLPSRTLWAPEDGTSSPPPGRPSTPFPASTYEGVNVNDRLKTQSLFESFDSAVELDAVETARPALVALSVEPDAEQDENTIPFKKWLGTLRKQHEQQALPHDLPQGPQMISIDVESKDDLSTLQHEDNTSTNRPRTSTIESSTRGFITAVKSASVTLAESSVATKSWLGGLTRGLHKGRHSRSNTLGSSSSTPDDAVDEVATARAIQRRHILEEVIESEESYVADLRVLQNVKHPMFILPQSVLTTHAGLYDATSGHSSA
jgi:hypothetical protein